MDERAQRQAGDGDRDPVAIAREILDTNRYMTLATADGDGRPWASPVWYAHEGYTDLLWVSRPGARHSRNLAVRPELAIVIFDSTVPEGSGQAVYVEALAEELDGAEREQGIAVISRRGVGPLHPRRPRPAADGPARLTRRTYNPTAAAEQPGGTAGG